MPAKILFLGVCAANRDLLLEWAAAGVLPAYQRVLQKGLTGFVESMPGYYVGTTWPSFATCVSPARHSRHYISQLIPGSYDMRREPKGEGIRRPPFWQAIADAGRKVALFDIPHSKVIDGMAGLQVVEWGAHDGDYARTLSSPAALGGEIEATFGPHPAGRSCDGHKTTEEYATFRDNLVAGAGRRADLTRQYLAQDNWDFFAQVWTESHCAGHQFWHFHDPRHPRHDKAAAAVVGDPIRDVYVAIDAAIGRVLDTVGDDTTVILYTGHGMGAKYDAQFLLDDILLRLGHAVAPRQDVVAAQVRAAGRHRLVDDALTRAWQALPGGVKRLAQPLRRVLRGAVIEGRPAKPPKIDRAASRCFTVPNNAVHGGIRINLVGREPHGTVQPGADYDALCERIAADLMAVVNADTGTPVADRVFRTDRVYDGDYLDWLPDLVVEWNQDHPVFAVQSDKVGRLEGIDPYTRTGDHRKGGLFVVMGPGIAPGRMDRAVQVTDLGPTIAHLLGVTLDDVDGAPIDDIVSRRAIVLEHARSR